MAREERVVFMDGGRERWSGKWWRYTRVIVLTIGPLKIAGRIAWRCTTPAATPEKEQPRA